MQEHSEQQKKPFEIKDRSLVERERFVGVFAWLMKEDKVQDPARYQRIKKEDG